MSESNGNLDFGFLNDGKSVPTVLMSEQGTPYIQCGTLKGLPLGAVVKIVPTFFKGKNDKPVAGLGLVVKFQVKFEDYQRDAVVDGLPKTVKARLRPNHISVQILRPVTLYVDSKLALKCIMQDFAKEVGAILFDLDDFMALVYEDYALKSGCEIPQENIYTG